jgi:reactive intermediate/imine deaminase
MNVSSGQQQIDITNNRVIAHVQSMRRLILPAILASGVISCAPAARPAAVAEPVFLPSADQAMRGLPFSDAVRVGDLLFLSGKIGTVPGKTELVPGGIAAETRQTMESIKATLLANGSSLDRIVKCTVMLADIGEWAAMNEVYAQYFPNHRPARSSFGTSGLALNARVEIECIAVAGR